MKPASPPSSRLLQLDILRGIAILLVLGRHFVINAHDAGYLLPLAGVWQRFGWTGVDLFFVLSGFLVGGLLCAEARDFGKIDFKRFIIRRGFKIWPLYYLFLITILLTSTFHYGQNPSAVAAAFDKTIPVSQTWTVNDRGLSNDEANASLWPSFFHIQNYMTIPKGESYWYNTRIFVNNHIPSLTPLINYLHDHMGLPRGHLWSLSIEEHFYLLLPFIMILLLKRGTTPGATGLRSSQTRAAASSKIHLLPYIALATMCVCTLYRCLTPVPTMGDPKDRLFFPWFSHMYPTHTRIDGLFFGVLLAYLYHFKPAVPQLATRFRWFLLILGILLISPMMFLSMEKTPWIPQIGFTMLYLGYGIILMAALAMNTAWMPTSTGIARLASRFLRALGWVGLFSYPIYLWHQDVGRFPVQYMLDAGFFNFSPAIRWLLATALYFTLAIAFSALIGKLIERPTLALRDRLFPRRAPALDAKSDSTLSPSSEPTFATS